MAHLDNGGCSGVGLGVRPATLGGIDTVEYFMKSSDQTEVSVQSLTCVASIHTFRWGAPIFCVPRLQFPEDCCNGVK